MFPIAYFSNLGWIFTQWGRAGKDLDLFQKMVKRDLTHLARHWREKSMPNNLSRLEKKALNDLEMDTNIVIRNVDKGGMVVVLNSDSYKSEALRQLSDSHTYHPLKNDPTIPFPKFFLLY